MRRRERRGLRQLSVSIRGYILCVQPLSSADRRVLGNAASVIYYTSIRHDIWKNALTTLQACHSNCASLDSVTELTAEGRYDTYVQGATVLESRSLWGLSLLAVDALVLIFPESTQE